ncbi:hypothetical protein VHEMI00782 [[Torrubiella] hemipterigena]|uniref:Alginate lyase 2 domain-containing protein n=1 Tax=[Torrubiella] hemipterigena TaxID=1531966 RepID=A0A0A1SK68_9HYPO|nr:hypothetical protein VHEMI00782 [[Torrubiella] hemipterigena]
MQLNSILLALSAATVAIAGSPVGGGKWAEDFPGHNDQHCAGGSVSGNTFKIPKEADGSHSGSGCSNGHLRAERRFDDYSSGTHQFGGSFKINSMSGDKISIKQTFHGSDGPFFIMGVQKNGRLYSVEGGAEIAPAGTADVGKSVRINTVHNTSTKKFKVYVNGKEAYSEDAPGGTFYDKIGAYTTNSGSGAMSITWSDVQFWHSTK